MGQTGIGALLHKLSGGSKEDPSDYYGRRIVSADINERRLRLELDGGATIHLWDDCQSCCERRYMSTDDDVQSLVGHRLTHIKPKRVECVESEHGGEDETCFVEVGTDDGFVTIVNHNEHNGFYGGFGLTVTETEPEAE